MGNISFWMQSIVAVELKFEIAINLNEFNYKLV